ncbi:MAG: HDOD domain-containing protein, partial [Gammaproteobacteria bacterium]|nr:HDOD domain-containing protein [Gammaproteobacteria bacterium]
FAFVQDLAAHVNRGEVKVPSFPDVVIRIRRVLESGDCDTEKLARVISTEPALAARILSIANSALMQRGSKNVQDLRTAINRLGHEMVRNTAMSVAVEQIFLGSSLGDHKERLRKIFRESTYVAALSFALARKLTRLNPDEALMAGLLHNVGKLYILLRASDHEDFFGDDSELDTIMDEWHPQIGRAIIESWGFSESLAAAAGDHLDLERSPEGPPDLTDLVTVARLMAQPAANEEFEPKKVRSWTRLHLDDERHATILKDSQTEIDALASALGG